MNDARDCLICGRSALIAYPEKIDPAKMSEFTYASRKRPELMHYEYRHCRKCRLLFASNLPDVHDLITAYHEASFDSERESLMAARTYVKALGDTLRPGITVLDVGCGDGTFLAACLTEGAAAVQGIEPSPAAVGVAPSQVRQAIFVGAHEQFESDRKFDLITLFQTIEHIRDPLDFIHSMKRLAAAGGHLAIACHDYRSPVNRLLGERSPIFDIEHLQIFSRDSVTELLKKAGLEVVSVRSYANTYPLSYWARLSPLPAMVKDSASLRVSPLGRLPISLRVGNIMAIGRF